MLKKKKRMKYVSNVSITIWTFGRDPKPKLLKTTTTTKRNRGDLLILNCWVILYWYINLKPITSHEVIQLGKQFNLLWKKKILLSKFKDIKTTNHSRCLVSHQHLIFLIICCWQIDLIILILAWKQWGDESSLQSYMKKNEPCGRSVHRSSYDTVEPHQLQAYHSCTPILSGGSTHRAPFSPQNPTCF